MWAKDVKGFTLVELMVVIAVVSLLSAIALPAYLGHMDKSKARTTQTSAKAAVADLQVYLDAYMAGDPYIMISDALGTQSCVEASNATTTGISCLSIFNQPSTATYPAYPAGMSTVISHFVNNSKYKGDKDAFRGRSLFVTSHGPDGFGQVLLSPSDSKSIVVVAYAMNSTPVFSQIVTAR
ncbi:MAG: prepilin-type N-terminal cleavage/methylation domain-containing protein [Nitrospirae bacterium]|nr:prepilin-type N-terminal cleavage/methylation domain-containing protein [Nitrospirota bacterium]